MRRGEGIMRLGAVTYNVLRDWDVEKIIKTKANKQFLESMAQ